MGLCKEKPQPGGSSSSSSAITTSPPPPMLQHSDLAAGRVYRNHVDPPAPPHGARTPPTVNSPSATLPSMFKEAWLCGIMIIIIM